LPVTPDFARLAHTATPFCLPPPFTFAIRSFTHTPSGHLTRSFPDTLRTFWFHFFAYAVVVLDVCLDSHWVSACCLEFARCGTTAPAGSSTRIFFAPLPLSCATYYALPVPLSTRAHAVHAVRLFMGRTAPSLSYLDYTTCCSLFTFCGCTVAVTWITRSAIISLGSLPPLVSPFHTSHYIFIWFYLAIFADYCHGPAAHSP